MISGQFFHLYIVEKYSHKKVLLRDRKRRTALGVASLALLSGVGVPLPWPPSLSQKDLVGWTGPVTRLPPESTWDQRLEYPPPRQDLGPKAGVPPPRKGPGTRGWGTLSRPPYPWTDKLKILSSLVLRMWVVKKPPTLSFVFRTHICQ